MPPKERTKMVPDEVLELLERAANASPVRYVDVVRSAIREGRCVSTRVHPLQRCGEMRDLFGDLAESLFCGPSEREKRQQAFDVGYFCRTLAERDDSACRVVEFVLADGYHYLLFAVAEPQAGRTEPPGHVLSALRLDKTSPRREEDAFSFRPRPAPNVPMWVRFRDRHLIEIDVDNVDRTLGDFKGARARLVRFSPLDDRLTIELRPEDGGRKFLSYTYCLSIYCPPFWRIGAPSVARAPGGLRVFRDGEVQIVYVESFLHDRAPPSQVATGYRSRMKRRPQ
jgi:hypothetical protein